MFYIHMACPLPLRIQSATTEFVNNGVNYNDHDNDDNDNDNGSDDNIINDIRFDTVCTIDV